MSDRAAYVEGLKTEREYLSRQPKPNTRRIAEVDAEIGHFDEKPAKRSRTRETATKKD